PVFKKAESIEFCSALMSHRMMSADPSNLVLCPFTIAVYSAWPKKRNICKFRAIEAIASAKFEEKMRYKIA
ncbi:MAG: DUF302 domain-containing protein, partial [Ketobacter sp.]|nr:DUF302 domain-containing protein [Ketobacter sp.]